MGADDLGREEQGRLSTGRRSTLPGYAALPLLLTTCLGPSTSAAGTLPGRLYLDDRPDVAWVSLEEAIAGGPVATWAEWGEFAPRQLLTTLEQRRLWAQRRLSLRDRPQFEELDRRLGRTRDEHGNCTWGLVGGGGESRFVSPADFVESHDRVAAGTIESRVPGFLYGRPVTVYGLRVDRVLGGSESPAVRAGAVVFVPHGDFDAEIEGMDVCYWARSRPDVPAIGRRAAVGLSRAPVFLWSGTEKTGTRHAFAGAWVTASFWFETESGGASTSVPGETPPRTRVERELEDAARHQPATR